MAEKKKHNPKEKGASLRGFTSLYDVDFLPIAKAMIRNTVSDPDISEFRIRHIERVTSLARLLAKDQKVDEKKLIVACHVHDMFKYVTTDIHGSLAADFLLTFIDEYYPEITGDKVEWLKVCDAVRNHSDKKMVPQSTNRYFEILQDADVLDHLTLPYIQTWFDNFDAESIEVVAKNMRDKVDRYEGRSANYKKVKKQLRKKFEAAYPNL